MAAHTKSTAETAVTAIMATGTDTTYVEAHLHRTDDGAYAVRALKRIPDGSDGGGWVILTDQ